MADPDRAGPAIIDRNTAVLITVDQGTTGLIITVRVITVRHITGRAIMITRIVDRIIAGLRMLIIIIVPGQGRARPLTMIALLSSNGDLMRCSAKYAS